MSTPDFQLIAPPHTPFDAQGRLALDIVADQARLAAETSVDGVFVGGSTGECASLTVRERQDLVERWVEMRGQYDLDVIVQVGHNCQADAIELAAHAQRLQADAVSAHAPCYFRPVNVDQLIEFLAPIAAAASDLPFYFYDIPPATNVRLPMVEFLTKARTRIPNLVGLKYSNDDLVQLQECLRVNNGENRILFGCDEILLTAVALGAHGAIGSTYNFAAPLYRRMLTAVAAGDLATARDFQGKSVSLIRCMARYGFMAACKTAMSWFGVECGPVRAPFRNLSAAETESLRADLEQLGAFTPTFTTLPSQEKAGCNPFAAKACS